MKADRAVRVVIESLNSVTRREAEILRLLLSPSLGLCRTVPSPYTMTLGLLKGTGCGARFSRHSGRNVGALQIVRPLHQRIGRQRVRDDLRGVDRSRMLNSEHDGNLARRWVVTISVMQTQAIVNDMVVRTFKRLAACSHSEYRDAVECWDHLPCDRSPEIVDAQLGKTVKAIQ